MKEKLTNNLGLKIISVLLAFFIWLAVVNISNPERSGSQEVPLEILNEKVLTSKNKTYELVSGKNTVTVSYKVRTLDAVNIRPGDFRAYIDLADMYEPTGAVPVKIEVKNNRALLVDSPTAKPGVVRVNTEDLQRKRFELSVKQSGTTEEGYTTGNASISPAYVFVSGPESKVGQISQVGIDINVEGANANLIGAAQPRFYDANGNELTDMATDDRVTLNRSEIDYEQEILKVKNLGLNFNTEGQVAEGYRFTGIEADVTSVAVMGQKSLLTEINTLNIPKSELNLDGAMGDREAVVDISKYLPRGVTLAAGDGQVRVVMKVERMETRTYRLGTDEIRQIGASSQYSYQFEEDSIAVVIRGLRQDMDLLVPEAMGAEVDVSGLEVGTHESEITFELGEAYELLRYELPQITVQNNGPASQDEEAQEAASAEDGRRKETEKQTE